jgi:hypothetical protein
MTLFVFSRISLSNRAFQADIYVDIFLSSFLSFTLSFIYSYVMDEDLAEVTRSGTHR